MPSMRNAVTLWGHDWNTAVTLQHIRARDGFYGRLGSRRPDGSFHQFQSQGQTFGGSPFIAVPGYGNLILLDNGFSFNQNSLLLSADKPFTQASPWGVNIAYTLSKAEQNGGNDNFCFDCFSVESSPVRSSGNDERHRIVANGIVDLPLDFQLSGILTLGSGTLISALYLALRWAM